jgi:hypothetical protein
MKPLVAALWALVIGVLAVPVHAQPADDAIRAAVKDGEKVKITSEGGRELRGRIVALGLNGLTLDRGRERTDVPYAQITRIAADGDSLLNGALIGLGVGVGVGLLAELNENSASDDPFCGMAILADCNDDSTGAYLLVWTGIGTLIGVGIDALIHRDRTLYERGGSAHVVLVPAVGRGGGGVRLSITW